MFLILYSCVNTIYMHNLSTDGALTVQSMDSVGGGTGSVFFLERGRFLVTLLHPCLPLSQQTTSIGLGVARPAFQS